MKIIWKTIELGIIILFLSSSLSCSVYSTDIHSEPLKVLVTGFEPFGEHEINPSQLIAEALDGQYIDGAEIIGVVLPVDFDESVEVIIQAIENNTPTIVMSTGLSARTREIDVEKCGINLRRRNESIWFMPQRLDNYGPMFRLSPFNTREIVHNMREAEIPSRQSIFAGFYICNALFYGTLGYIDKNDLQMEAGFIHVPLLESQDPDGMDLETMVEAVTIAIETSLK